VIAVKCAAANKRAEGRKRSPLPGQEAAQEKSVRRSAGEAGRERRFNARARGFLH